MSDVVTSGPYKGYPVYDPQEPTFDGIHDVGESRLTLDVIGKMDIRCTAKSDGGWYRGKISDRDLSRWRERCYDVLVTSNKIINHHMLLMNLFKN